MQINESSLSVIVSPTWQINPEAPNKENICYNHAPLFNSITVKSLESYSLQLK